MTWHLVTPSCGKTTTLSVLNDAAISNASDLIDELERNMGVLGRQIHGLSHADALLQPQPRGNCLNWVLGHIALHREYMLQYLGTDPEAGEASLTRYARGSAPITQDGDDVWNTDKLVATLHRQQERLASALSVATGETLAQRSTKDPKKTVGGFIDFLAWHETLHIGTTEILRQLAGTDDMVI